MKIIPTFYHLVGDEAPGLRNLFHKNVEPQLFVKFETEYKIMQLLHLEIILEKKDVNEIYLKIYFLFNVEIDAYIT